MQTSQLKIIRKQAFTATPWKNGGGITHEAIRVPSAGDPFQWRVSVAHIDASGPFSEFPMHDRKMVLLKGAGIDLRFADGTTRALRQVGELIEFDGAVAAHCDLLSGPCVDLNLMTLKTCRAAARVERVVDSLALGTSLHATTLVFPIDGAIALEVTKGLTVTLEAWDLAILARGTGVLRREDSVQSAPLQSAPVPRTSGTAVFVATLEFVSGEQQAGLAV